MYASSQRHSTVGFRRVFAHENDGDGAAVLGGNREEDTGFPHFCFNNIFSCSSERYSSE